MTAIDDPTSGADAANPGPFVVSHPCPVCHGEGVRRAALRQVSGHRCAALLPRHEGRPEAGRPARARASPQLRQAGEGDDVRLPDRHPGRGHLGAELALGEGPGRIYIVEPTGPFTDDPNLTDKKFPGNPTKSYRSPEPLRVMGEVTGWRGHPPEALKAMHDGIERARRQGIEPID